MAATFQDQVLKDKVALISGGTRGINLGIARGFMEAGAKVVVFGRNEERAASAEAELRQIGGGEALGLSCDVRDYDGVAAVVERTAKEFGTLDIVIAGAAGNFFAPVVGLSANAFKTVIDIDLLGTFNLFRASFDHLTKPGASLIAITAGQADNPRAFQAHACAAKAGVNMLTKTLAIEWGPAGVRSNLISPGAIADTEGVKFLAADPDQFDKSIKRIPSRGLGTVEDIADAAIFLSSDAARYVNGHVMYVDGGLCAGDGSQDALTPLKRD
ncbi:MAG: SDR family oxidoreductase [Pseudomonadota bacterium]